MSAPDELPGMMQLAVNVRKQVWPHTMDAKVWAEQFAAQYAKTPEMATDEGWMLSWFANAIMAGYDTACTRADAPKADSAPSAIADELAEWLDADDIFSAAECLRDHRDAILAALRAQPGGAVPPFWWTRGHRTHPPRPFATKMHDAHWLVRHEDGTLDTFAYETPDLYVAEGESVVEYRRVAATKADSAQPGGVVPMSALLEIGEHAMSLMTAKAADEERPRLYHPCDGCEKVLAWLQANGRCLDVDATKADAREDDAERQPVEGRT